MNCSFLPARTFRSGRCCSRGSRWRTCTCAGSPDRAGSPGTGPGSGTSPSWDPGSAHEAGTAPSSGRNAPPRTDSRSPSRPCATSSRPTRRTSTCPSSAPYRSPASAPSRGHLSRRPALRGCQAPNAVPIAYLDTRHHCRAVEASKPYPVQTVRDRSRSRMPPFVALESRTPFFCQVTEAA